jgi:hypothetical protein
MSDVKFRVTRIDLDDNQDVDMVHAVADDATVAVISELTAGPVGTVGRYGADAVIRMPVRVMLEIWRAQDTMPGTDPRYRYPVSDSLGRIYFGLISEEG